MTLLHLYEPAVDALVNRLRTSLDGYVTAVNAQVADTTMIDPVPADRVLPYVPPLDMVTAFPTVGVGRLPGRWRDDSGHSATGEYGLSVVAFVQDANQDALTKKADRTLRAVVSCVLDGRPAAWGTDPGQPYGVTLRELIPGAVLGDRPGPNQPPNSYLTWMGVAVTVLLDEGDDFT